MTYLVEALTWVFTTFSFSSSSFSLSAFLTFSLGFFKVTNHSTNETLLLANCHGFVHEMDEVTVARALDVVFNGGKAKDTSSHFEGAVSVHIGNNFSNKLEHIKLLLLFLTVFLFSDMLVESLFICNFKFRFPIHDSLLIVSGQRLEQLIHANQDGASHRMSLDFFHVIKVKLNGQIRLKRKGWTSHIKSLLDLLTYVSSFEPC